MRTTVAQGIVPDCMAVTGSVKSCSAAAARRGRIRSVRRRQAYQLNPACQKYHGLVRKRSAAAGAAGRRGAAVDEAHDSIAEPRAAAGGAAGWKQSARFRDQWTCRGGGSGGVWWEQAEWSN